jgi:hypothetical protein
LTPWATIARSAKSAVPVDVIGFGCRYNSRQNRVVSSGHRLLGCLLLRPEILRLRQAWAEGTPALCSNDQTFHGAGTKDGKFLLLATINAAQLLDQLVNGVTLGMLYILVALGLNIILGLMGVINFSHGAFFMLGAYLTYTLVPVTGF